MVFSLRLLLVLSCFIVLVASLGAEEKQAPPMSEKPDASMEAYGVAHPECLEWTNACRICARHENDVACSTPGIACLPKEIFCQKKKS